MQKYRIKKIHGNLYYILSEDYKKTYLGVLRGKMRLLVDEHPSGIPYRNPGCVGDFVIGEEIQISNENLEKKEREILIKEILPRKNILIRSSPSEIHPIGSNLDYAMAIVSLKNPIIRTGFIDRFLIACFTEHIEPIIFFSKCDLLSTEEEDEKILSQSIYYQNIVKHIFWDNLLEPLNRKHLTKLLNKMNLSIDLPSFKDFIEQFKSGTILITGQSGTGKSTLTNKIIGKEVQKTNSISKTTGKGKHTTTSSILIPLKSNQELILIDTPGIKEWGLSHLTKKQIYESYPEWKHFLGMCKFKNCEHLPGTQGCMIQEKIKENILPSWRLHNLNHIIQSLEYYERIRPGDYKKPTGRFHNNIK